MTQRIVVLSGAGISAESGLRTFRDMGGYWHEHRIEDVATPEGFARNPALVLDFYNQRRHEILAAKPNAAHAALAQLEARYDVTIITQNIDDLHERAGSSRVLHVHGDILKGQSSIDSDWVRPLEKADILLGDQAADGSQLRPHVVWFGEAVLQMDAALAAISRADKVLVVGTALAVYPVAGLVQEAPDTAEKVLIALEMERLPAQYRFIAGRATDAVPQLVANWMNAVVE